MSLTEWNELKQRLGGDRVTDPPGALPQAAVRLDACGPPRPYEFEVSVERLCLDSTSHQEIAQSCEYDADAMAERIIEIVAARGKMHNPATDSGGILLGTVARVGQQLAAAPGYRARIATLGSLTVTPLRLQAVTRVDPASAQVEVEGTAYVFDRALWAELPEDVPESTALALYDVCALASQMRFLVPQEGTVCVLGTGHAGNLALATVADGSASTRVAVDIDENAVRHAHELGLCEVGVAADLRSPIAAVASLREAGVPPADLTVVAVNATGCESAAILATADGGTVLFFSMATNFSAAALAVDGLGSNARLTIGSGYSADRGAYAIDLWRRSPALREALSNPVQETA